MVEFDLKEVMGLILASSSSQIQPFAMVYDNPEKSFQGHNVPNFSKKTVLCDCLIFKTQ